MKIRQETLWERWFAEQRFADTTRRTYTETLRSFQRRFPVSAERVTTQQLIDFLTTDADGTSTRRAPATLNRQRTTLRVFFRWAKRRGFLRDDPAEGLDELMLGRGQRRQGRWLTRAQAQALLAAIDTSELHGMRDHALVLTALLTGLRRAELAQLRWQNVDLASGLLAVVGKGGKLATIGLPSQALDALTLWRAHVRAAQRRAPRPNEPVFPAGRSLGGLHGSRHYRMEWDRTMHLGTVQLIVRRSAEAAGLGMLGTHDLRRSFAGFLDEDGCDLKGIQAALRHSSPAPTVACYLEKSPRRAVEATKGLSL